MAAARDHTGAILRTGHEKVSTHRIRPAMPRPSPIVGRLGPWPGRFLEQLGRFGHSLPGATPHASASGLTRLISPRAYMSAPSPIHALAVATAAIAMPSFPA